MVQVSVYGLGQYSSIPPTLQKKIVVLCKTVGELLSENCFWTTNFNEKQRPLGRNITKFGPCQNNDVTSLQVKFGQIWARRSQDMNF